MNHVGYKLLRSIYIRNVGKQIPNRHPRVHLATNNLLVGQAIKVGV